MFRNFNGKIVCIFVVMEMISKIPFRFWLIFTVFAEGWLWFFSDVLYVIYVTTIKWFKIEAEQFGMNVRELNEC